MAGTTGSSICFFSITSTAASSASWLTALPLFPVETLGVGALPLGVFGFGSAFVFPVDLALAGDFGLIVGVLDLDFEAPAFLGAVFLEAERDLEPFFKNFLPSAKVAFMVLVLATAL